MPVRAHELLANRTFPFTGHWGAAAACGLRIFRHPDGDRPDVVIVTELPWNRGASVRHAAERLRNEVCAHYRLDRECIAWIEHLPPDDDGGELYQRVEFLDEPHDPPGRCPLRRHPIDRRRVERLVGGSIRELTPT